MAYKATWERSSVGTTDLGIAPDAGDILVACWVNDSTGSAPINGGNWPPAGWTAAAQLTSTYDAQTLQVAYKKADGTEIVAEGGDNNNIMAVWSFDGRDGTTFIDVAVGTFESSTGGTTSDISQTPVTDGVDLIFIQGCDVSDSADNPAYTFSTTAGTTGAWTTRTDLQSGFYNIGAGTATQSTAGAITARCSTVVTAGRNSVLIALRPAAGSGITSSAAVTEAADTSSASGAVQVSGSAAPTEAADTSSASATVDVSGSAAVTEAADTSAASGSVDISGSAAVTEAADTSAASGTVSGGAATGTADVTEADDSVAASGTVDVSGSAAVTEADDTTSASGVVGIEAEARPSGYGNWNDLPVWNKRRRPRSARRGRVITVSEFLRAERERSERRARAELEHELEQAALEELEAAPAVPDPAPRIPADLAPVARLVASADNRRKKREEQQGIADEDLTLYAAMLLVAINGG